MKRIIISWIMISAIFLAAEVANATSEYICIDPSHGGPGASQYGSNGDGAGTYGLVYHLSEQWVNLQVAYALRHSLYHWANCPMSCLHHNGPPPVDPFERGDANNDCLIDMGM